ncbi:flavin-containing monooxygenase [Paraconexibacter algicola]|nr:NAD(P)/FAD-dependent oxidoreductase [Paraconexibacter algicola]
MTPSPRVAIVGAGFGGLAAAIELERAGVDYTVFERADEVGGVWQANTYPGAACDVPSVIYQFSHALNDNWGRRFGTQAEIRDYLRNVSLDTGVRGRVRFGSEVTTARFDQATGTWVLTLADGATESCDVLVCATGQLSRPSFPPVPGRDVFAGEQFHSAEWDHTVELADRRVVVVGSGASAVQIVPAIADAAREITVIQRDPNWVVNKIDWSPPRAERILASRVPGFLRAYRALMWWWFESRYPVFVPRRMSAIRKALEWRQRRFIRRSVGGDRALAEKLTPDYALGCNRILLSREWYPTLAREDVKVVAAAVDEVTPDGLLVGGERVEADVIVWCTGFTPTEYLAPMQVVGRDGREIREHWAEGPEAYLGLSTPGFPNLFMLYGPNTGSLTNTIVSLLEYQAGYIRQAVEHIAAHGEPLEVRESVHRGFNEELQRRLGRTVFTLGCPGWYTTAGGKVTTVWTGSHLEYRRRTRRFDADAYEHVH